MKPELLPLLIAAVLLGSYPFVNGVRRLGRTLRNVMSEKKKLSLQLEQTEFDRISQQAADAGLSISEFVRRVLSEPGPPAPMASSVPQSAIDAAFGEIDKHDAIDMGSRGILPVPPRHALDRTDKKTRQPYPGTAQGPHPCLHLSTTRIPAQLRGQCQGTCQHRSQTGRTCFWPPTTAHSCGFFEPKLVTLKRAAGH